MCIGSKAEKSRFVLEFFVSLEFKISSGETFKPFSTGK